MRDSGADLPGTADRDRKTAMKIRSLAAVTAVAVVVLIALIVRYMPSSKHMSSEEYFGLSGADDVAVIVNGVKGELCGRMIDSASFIPYETVHTRINPSVYYDEPASELIVTLPEEKRVYPLRDGRALDGRAVLLDGELYIAADYLVEIMGVDLHLYEEPMRQVVRLNGIYRTCEFTKDAPVRRLAGIKSPIIRDMEKGDRAYVLDLDAEGNPLPEKVEGWVYVATYNGYTGYVRENAVEERETEELSLPDPFGEWTACGEAPDGKINMVFHQTDSAASNRALLKSVKDVTGVNVIAPTWFYLNSTDGEVRSVADAEYVKEAHGKGFDVWAVLNDFDGALGSSSETAAVLQSYDARTKVIDSVVKTVLKVGADGINVDIELVRKNSADAFLEFLRELSVECRNAGLVLSVDTYVPAYTGYLNRTEQARVVDYIVTMCYDEHTSGSEKAGPVASVGFVEEGIRKTLTEVPPEKLIAAIPFYSRLWKTGEGQENGTWAYGMSKAKARAKELGIELAWDESSGQYYGEKEEGDYLWQIWVEDRKSLEEKMKLIRAADCAGAAEWKLGMEQPSVWQMIEEYLA